MRLEATRVSYAYRAAQPCLHSISLAVNSSDVAFVLGANGSGKTTLLACLAGVRHPTAGSVLLEGHPLRALGARERAKQIGVVPQFHDMAFEFSVEEAVGFGRAPYIGLFSQPGREDRLAVNRALDAVGITNLRRRSMFHVSGGERQLTWIARGLAQGAQFLLLDEPTAHLDPQHEHAVFAVVSSLAKKGAAFVVASHHPEVALAYATQVTFLKNGEALRSGHADEVIAPDILAQVYGMDFAILEGESGERAIVPRVGNIR